MSSSTSNNQNNWIFSIIGVVLVAVLLVFVNSIFSKSRMKIDATEHKLFTLTEGTKQILEDLDGQLEKFDSDGERARLKVRLYATLDKDIMPPELLDYAETIEVRLREFKDHSGDRIELETIDPEPYSEEEVNANQNGVTPIPIAQDTQIYLGVSVSALDKNVPIPFLNPSNNAMLEYDLARAITEAVTTKKPSIGIMSAYQMTGGGHPPGPGAGGQTWYVRSVLSKDYAIQDVPLSADKIDKNLDALLVIHPAGLEEAGQFAIDQYLLGGGKVIAMLDPFSFHNRRAAARPQQIPGMPAPNQPITSDMDTLLDAWGVQFESINVVADRSHMGRRGNPVFLGVPAGSISDENPAINQIKYLEMSFAGAFYGKGAKGLEKNILVESSGAAGTVSPHVLFGDNATASKALNDVQPGSKPLELAISLQGKFKTAFPDGAPKEDPDPDEPEAEGDESEGDEDEPEEDTSLKEATATGLVILIADTDMITDDGNAPQRFRIGGSVIESQRPNGNIAFVENLVNYAAGNTNLLAVRSRGDNTRPFTKYAELIKEAAEEQQKELDDLIEKRQTAERKFREVRRKQEAGENLQAADLQIVRNYEDERVKTGKRIVELKRELRKGIDSLEARWKWLNIALMPGIVCALAIGHLMLRRSKTSAR